MNLKELMQGELTIVNSSNAFWQALDSNFSQTSCGHVHGQGEEHFHMAGNFSIAQEKIRKAITTVFGADFNVENQEHRDHLFTLAAVQKAQDQLSGGNDFVSQRTSDFNKHFEISESLAGKNIAGETVSMPNAKKYLVQKFNLSSTLAKADVIWKSQEMALSKAGKLVDLGFKDAADALIEFAGSRYKAAPTLAVAGLTLGTAQMVLRSCGNQKSADILRDNIGASTEAAAFFVLVNGVLENLSHSFILAAPAFTTVAAYDLGYSKLMKPIYDYFRSENGTSQTEGATGFTYDVFASGSNASQIEADNPNRGDVELAIDLTRLQYRDIEAPAPAEDFVEEDHLSGSFKKEDLTKTLNILKRAKSFIDQDEMWIGLRKSQLTYRDNNLEDDLKTKLGSLIDELKKNSPPINKLLQRDFGQTLRDSFEMMKAYFEVYEDKNPGSGTKQFLHEFCDHFTRDAILLAEPTKEAKIAAFYCRSYNSLVSFEERIKESLPHMPTGQQVLLAATVIGALYSASAIYKSVTGEEEVYSDYVTNFPDHLFEWLHLDQMYQNMGGGAEITEYFKDFFAGFNLAENSTHLGIAIAPFAAYAKMGSKMFEGIHYAPANYLAYAADLTNSYIAATKATIGGWFGENNPAPAVPAVPESDNEPALITGESEQTDLPEEKKSDPESDNKEAKQTDLLEEKKSDPELDNKEAKQTDLSEEKKSDPELGNKNVVLNIKTKSNFTKKSTHKRLEDMTFCVTSKPEPQISSANQRRLDNNHNHHGKGCC